MFKRFKFGLELLIDEDSNHHIYLLPNIRMHFNKYIFYNSSKS
jgi:hypothetical protein